MKALTAWVEKLGPFGVVVFALIYAVSTVLFVPGSLLTITAGLIFGIGLGTLAAWSGALLGASLYLGAAGKAGLGGGDKAKSPLEWTFLAAGLLATIGVTFWVSRIAKNALKDTGASKRRTINSAAGIASRAVGSTNVFPTK